MSDPDALPPWPSRPALFLDLDGTLLEIAEHPQHVMPTARLRALLPKLPVSTQGAVALISGRSIADVDRILAPHSFVVAGVHGLERRDAEGRILSAAGDGGLPPDLREALGAFAARHAGLWLEDKRLSLAVHYRSRPELEGEVRRFVESLEARLPADVEILQGRKVLEIKPRVADKGEAIRAFMAEPPFSGRTPVFVGDDVTDEAGFRAVNELGGVSVKVGSGATSADWRLANVEAVLGWLEVAGAEGPRPARTAAAGRSLPDR